MIKFKEILHSGVSIGQVISVTDITCRVKGFRNLQIGAILLFESDSLGFVKSIYEDEALVLIIENNSILPGEIVLLYKEKFEIPVGFNFLGRIINVLGDPLDKMNIIKEDSHREVFHDAYSIIQKDDISKQMETGFIAIDNLIPLAFGQREAILGDNNTGKTSFVLDLIKNQDGKALVVYVIIGKKQDEILSIISYLEEIDALKYTVVVVAESTSLPVISYLAPFAGCSIAEYFWEKEKDVIIVYDDLIEHAKSYRELSLLSNTAPGRDSYPADIFAQHAHLLERAGRIQNNKGSLTALPIVSIYNNDLTGYIPTNIISITDGQIFFDKNLFAKGQRPAINTSISISRIGKKVQDKYIQDISDKLNLVLVKYAQSEKFSHFGTNLSDNVLEDLYMGEKIQNLFKQDVGQVFSLFEQRVLLTLLLYYDLPDLHANDIEYIQKRVKEINYIDNFTKTDLTDSLVRFLIPDGKNKK
jgi:F-type H+-transporting ATPase subunit alpha